MSLADLTVKELRLRAAALEIRGRSRMRKSELLDAIEAAEAVEAAELEAAPEAPAASAPTEAAEPVAPAPASIPWASSDTPWPASQAWPASLPAQEPEIAAAPEAPAAPPSQDEIFIDRGVELPASYPTRRRTRAMVHNPNAAWLYWEGAPLDWRRALPEARAVTASAPGPRGAMWLQVPSSAIEQPNPLPEPGPRERWVRPTSGAGASAAPGLLAATPPYDPARPPSVPAPALPNAAPGADPTAPFTPYRRA